MQSLAGQLPEYPIACDMKGVEERLSVLLILKSVMYDAFIVEVLLLPMQVLMHLLINPVLSMQRNAISPNEARLS